MTFQPISTMAQAPPRRPGFLWALRAAAVAGLAWNAFGLFRFATTTFASAAELAASGMTPAQAELYASLPAWMHAAFALGVIGGLLGCALLLFGDRRATPVFAASLAAYVVLWAGDLALGVFAAFGWPQVAILSFVVAVAAALLACSRRAERRGIVS